MELRHLRYFVAVAEEMNVHKAAKRLHISQPPLSVAIRQLEDEIGAPLFTRRDRGIHITRAGEDFLTYARKALQDAATAKENAFLIGAGKRGTLKLSFVSSAVSGILQDIILKFKAVAPDVKLDISQSVNGKMGQDILEGRYDIALMRWPEYLPDSLKTYILTREGWSIACRKDHPFSKRTFINVKDLAKEKLIFYPRYNNPAGYDSVMKLFHNQNLAANIVQEAPEQMTIAGLVASGMGIGIVPACMSNIPIHGVVHRPLKGTKSLTGFALVYRDKEDAIIDIMRNISI